MKFLLGFVAGFAAAFAALVFVAHAINSADHA
jgi:hypothetical protein